MDWQIRLVNLYVYICKTCASRLCVYYERFSNNAHPEFTDEEVITIYLFGIMEKRREIKEIYNFTKDHLSAWFPRLPSYAGYVQRLNRLDSLFPVLVEQILTDFPESNALQELRLLDSMPIIMANSKRSSSAKVADQFANKGYCPSKRMYFYGAKLHVLGLKRPETLPLPDFIGLTPATDHDLTAFKIIAPHLVNGEVFADKAYVNELLKIQLKTEQNLDLNTPIKKEKGQEELFLFDKVLSTAVSRVRQPIESLFNWIDQKTGIQMASKVRSYKGLVVHVFARLAAAMFILAFNS